MRRESDLIYDVRLQFSVGATRLFRMQSGNFMLIDGRRISVGFPGLSDLIGWNSRIIRQSDVGRRVAVFTALEGKSDTGSASAAQLAFLRAVKHAGGIQGVIKSEDDAYQLLMAPIGC